MVELATNTWQVFVTACGGLHDDPTQHVNAVVGTEWEKEKCKIPNYHKIEMVETMKTALLKTQYFQIVASIIAASSGITECGTASPLSVCSFRTEKTVMPPKKG